MAKPDTTDGWFKIANEVAEALATAPMSSSEYAVIWWVLRQTWGYKGRHYAPYVCADVARSLRFDPRHLRRVVDGLIRCRVLVFNKAGEIGYQKDYDQWGDHVPYGASMSGRPRPKGRTPSPHYEDVQPPSIGHGAPIFPSGERQDKDKRQERQGPTSQPAQALLPNGKPDRAHNRGEYIDRLQPHEVVDLVIMTGMDIHPAGAPDWDREAFQVRDRAVALYDAALRMANDPAMVKLSRESATKRGAKA